METSIDRDENRYIAKILHEVADLLERQNASSFRINAYRTAADYAARSAPPLRGGHSDLGLKGLEDLPTIGLSIAQAISEILETGSLSMLLRLRGELDPEKLFQTVPTIGPHIAQRLHDELHLETLEAAAIDGRLGALKGIGPRRVSNIQQSLARILGRRRPTGRRDRDRVPPIELILKVDRGYRSKAKRRLLAFITPKRFNPTVDIHIPILHTEIDNWRFTAIFSNSPTAHRFGRADDWVVIYFEKDGQAKGQCTVLTEKTGALEGKRVVRGFEAECAKIYTAQASVASSDANASPGDPV